jgi:hypothetical protein
MGDKQLNIWAPSTMASTTPLHGINHTAPLLETQLFLNMQRTCNVRNVRFYFATRDVRLI